MFNHHKIETEIKKSFKTITKTYRECNASYIMTSDLFATVLCDNYYIIEQTTKCSALGIRNLNLNGIDTDKSAYPPIYGVLNNMLETSKNRILNEGEISAFLLKHQQNFYFHSLELYACKDILSALLLKRIADLCSIEGERPVTTLEFLIKALREYALLDYDRIYSDVSYIEHVFKKDPSGDYPLCDIATKRMYQARLSKYAKKHKLSEADAADRILCLANEGEGKEKHIGFYLMKGKNIKAGRLYFAVIYLLTAFLTALCAYSQILLQGPYGGLLALLLILPMREISKQVAATILASRTKVEILPRLEIKDIPDDGKTVVVITTLLFGGEADSYLFDRLEDLFHLCRDKNVTYGILGDLRDAPEMVGANDEKIISYAKDRIDALNGKYGERFALWVRRRSFAPGEGRFMGWERKRGALIELTRHLRGMKTTIDTTVGDSAHKTDIKYVITLDADTQLLHSGIEKMIGTAMHPLNRPQVVTVNGVKIVRSGHGVFQPVMEVSVRAAAKTGFSLLRCGSGGIDMYSTRIYDIYQHVFDEGIYCGKGIFDVDAYIETMNDAFPEESVLSHDLLEGTRLRAGLMCDVVCLDSTPANAISYFTRLHRWIRGDVQALAFAGKKILNVKNEKVKNPISYLSRFKLYDNFMRALTPVSVVAAIIISAFFSKGAAVFTVLAGLSYLILPALYSFLSPLFYANIRAYKSLCRRFFSNAVPTLWRVLLGLLYEISAYMYAATISLDAIVRSLWRMLISRKHMLSWVTAAEGDALQVSGVLLYLWKMKWSLVVGIGFLFTLDWAHRLLGVFFIIFPFVSYRLSYKRKTVVSPQKRQKTILKKHARDMWRFFDDFVTERDNHLPPDNYQLAPVEATARRTSPTNIGMYLISVLSARDFGFIDTNTMYQRVSSTLNTIEQLPKWNGHLYNWYDTVNAQIMNPAFISTVDSGNFICSLVTLKQGMLEYTCENTDIISLVRRIDKLIKETDFTHLYNSKRKLFSIGYNIKEGKLSESYYDMYMSEARIASYYAIASGAVGDEHWRTLSRRLIGENGYIGLASWSGTVFEYFMPSIFLPVFHDALEYEALRFTFLAERKYSSSVRLGSEGVRKIWGKSESGYYAFDSDMNYQYRAFGQPVLGLRRGLERDAVYSPYSLYLMLKVSLKNVCSGLESMIRAGMYGKYGLYEAIDLTPSRVGSGYAIVRSYMAHHIGMSIAACANACFDDVMTKRFMSSPDMRASAVLLEKKLPTDAVILKKKPITPTNIVNLREETKEEKEKIELRPDLPQAALLSNSRTRLLASYDGSMALYDGGLMLTRPSFDDRDKLFGVSMLFCADGVVYSALPDNGQYTTATIRSFIKGAENIQYKAVFESPAGRIHSTLTLTLKSDKSLCLLRFEARGAFTEITPLFVFEPVMAKVGDYFAHPAYAKLFLEAEYSEEEKVLFYKRRPRSEEDCERWLGVAMGSESGNFSFETQADQCFIGLRNLGDLILDGNKRLSCRTGATINPVCIFKTHAVTKGRFFCDYMIAYSTAKKDVSSQISQVRREKNRLSLFERDIKRLYELHRTVSGADRSVERAVELILSAMVHPLKQEKQGGLLRDMTFERGMLWQYGISGDNKIVTLDIEDFIGKSSSIQQQLCIIKFLRAHKFLMLAGVRFDLVLLFNKSDNSYEDLNKNSLMQLITECEYERMISRKGGIFLLPKDTLDERGHALISKVSVLYLPIDNAATVEGVYFGIRDAYINSTTEKVSGDLYINKKNMYCDTPVKPSYTEKKKEKKAELEVFGGFFTEDGFSVSREGRNLPWSYVYTNHIFGTLLTHRSLGFTWYKNSREMRLSKFTGEPYNKDNGEFIFIYLFGRAYDLCACADAVEYNTGSAVYSGVIEDIEYKIKVGCDSKFSVKTAAVYLKNIGNYERSIRLSYYFSAVMGDIAARGRTVVSWISDDTVFFSQALSDYFSGRRAFIYGDKVTEQVVEGCESETVCDITLQRQEEDARAFFIGCVPAKGKAYNVIRKRFKTCADIEASQEDYARQAKELFSKIKIKTSNPALDRMINFYLPYQAFYTRMLGRTGFYQSSGAYGFRDQLQDSLSMLYYEPKFTKAQIVRAAAHQYIEGDVQHWWHHINSRGEYSHFGMRTRCSDDLLWLPYVTAMYIERTGDEDVLDIPIRYIQSEVLADGELERGEIPKKTTFTESLYMHCVRAIEKGLTQGAHGLPLFGNGDWNDGMSRVGALGYGESVWLAWFCIMVVESFLPYCINRGDQAAAEKYQKKAEEYRRAIEEYAYDGKWYLRGFYDNGDPLGSHISDECQISLNAQSFAVIAGKGSKDNPRVESALREAEGRLYDREYGLLKLFTPAFKDTVQEPGYIKGYPAGLRENGGQYTHAAVWGAIGFLRGGYVETGTGILLQINPAQKCGNERLAEIYKNEPYALSGDVYSNPAHYGRGGWSHYTGAASWFVRAVIEDIVGIKLFADRIEISPRLSRLLPEIEVRLSLGDCIYDIMIQPGDKEEGDPHVLPYKPGHYKVKIKAPILD